MFSPMYVSSMTSTSYGYDPTSPYINTAEYAVRTTGQTLTASQRNPVYEDIQNGKFILYEYASDGRHKFGTPYMSPSCIKGLTYEIPLYTNRTFSVIALFKQGNNPKPIIVKFEYSTKDTWIDSGPKRYLYNIPFNDLSTPLPEYQFAFPYSAYYNNSYVLKNNLINYNTSYAGGSIILQPGAAPAIGTHFIPGFTATAISSYQCIGANNIINYNFTNCQNSQNFRYSTQNKIESDNLQEGLTIYPNPSKGEFNLAMNFGEEKNTTCMIYNSSGEVVYSNSFGELKIAQQTIPLNVEDGLYLVKITHGDKIIQKKVLIIK